MQKYNHNANKPQKEKPVMFALVKPTLISIHVFVVALLAFSGGRAATPLLAAELPPESKSVIDALQPILYKELLHSDQELARTKQEFQEYYKEDVIPRLSNISKHIDPEAVRWIDLDDDGVAELVFYTAGVAPSRWGPREKIFVVKVGADPTENSVPANGKHAQIIAAKAIYPTVTYIKRKKIMGYMSSGFYSFNRKDNSTVWVLAFMQLGVSASTHVAVEMTYNKAEKKVGFRSINSAFPIKANVEHAQSLPTESDEKLKQGRQVIKAMRDPLKQALFGGRKNSMLRKLHKKIDGAAIHWLDMDWDSIPELVFWTKFVGASSWNGQDSLVVIQVADDPKKLKKKDTVVPVGIQHASIRSVYKFDAFGYQKLSFHRTPTKGHNRFLRGVLTFVEEASPIDVYHVIELTYNKYEYRIEFDRFKVSFPVGVR